VIGRPRFRLDPALAVLMAVALALALAVAAALPLLDPDEGRNAEVAREMAASGDLVVPHLAGMPYLDKPPAFFWAAALAVRLFGHSPLAARLPSLVAAALTLALFAIRAQRSGGARFARIAVALLGAAPLFLALSAYVIFDMLLTLCVTVVWLGLAAEVTGGASARVRAWMFLFLGLGLLVKGPVMLAWALGGSACAALFSRSRTPLRWLAWWPGWALALGLAGGWFALAVARHPEYPHYAFLEESLERLTSNSFHRDQPWWFVPAVLIGGTLPWSLHTPWSRAHLSRAPEAVRASSVVALGFVAFAAVFFSASHSKLVTYLLPAVPALAWLAAAMWFEAAPQRRSGWIAAALLGATAWALLHVTLTASLFAGRAGPAHALETLPLVIAVTHTLPFAVAVMVAAAGVCVFAARTRQPGTALGAALIWFPTLVVAGLAMLAPLARAFRLPSGAGLARAVAAAGPGSVRYERCYSPGTDFLLGRPSTLVSAEGAETTSNYQWRYRSSLAARGLWTPSASPSESDSARFVVRPRSEAGTPPPPGGEAFFMDARFVAYRIGAPAPR
jgi:hypothetical protein